MFAYDDAITERFPTIRAAVIQATGLSNGPSSPELLAEYRTEQRAASERLAATAIAEIPSIAAWRRVFSAFGVKPTQHRNAAESLLRRLDKQGDIPTISTLVDLGNLIAIRYALPVAVLDLAGITGSTTVGFADGTERFTDLGADEAVHPDPGEAIFVDSAGVASARRWCWRQSAQSATSATTVDAMIVVEGHHESAALEIDLALADLVSVLKKYQPDGQVTTYLLSPRNPQTGTASRDA